MVGLTLGPFVVGEPVGDDVAGASVGRLESPVWDGNCDGRAVGAFVGGADGDDDAGVAVGQTARREYKRRRPVPSAMAVAPASPGWVLFGLHRAPPPPLEFFVSNDRHPGVLRQIAAQASTSASQSLDGQERPESECVPSPPTNNACWLPSESFVLI